MRYLSQTELTLKKISQKHRKLSQAWKIIASIQLLCDKYRKCQKICDIYRKHSNFCDKYRKNSNFCDILKYQEPFISCSDSVWRFEHGVVRPTHHGLHAPVFVGTIHSDVHINVLLSCCLLHTKQSTQNKAHIILRRWVVRAVVGARDARWRVGERDAQDGPNALESL